MNCCTSHVYQHDEQEKSNYLLDIFVDSIKKLRFNEGASLSKIL